ncbi:hypothetical protein [Pseudoalteromonas rubra]|uniref:hypothetical protein n=1 Tax=Pseudoalteromonas rubra TaxID=43658 RepID=UPI00026CA80A|nr:hypothetical protein [Pseudoalteromonas rubra]
MDESNKVVILKIILILLILLLLFPCYLAMYGIFFALTDGGPHSHEGFTGAGLIAFNSGIVWFPQLVLVYMFRNQLNNIFKLVSIAPFLVLFVCFLVSISQSV